MRRISESSQHCKFSTKIFHLSNRVVRLQRFVSINTVANRALRAHATLIQRPIAIHVFDAQQDGPTFGARALLALTAPHGPLHGLEIQFQHHVYDWNDTAPLARQLAGVPAERSGSVPAASYTTLIVILYVVQLVMGALIYDLAAAALLACAGLFANLAGVLLWPAVALHAALAVWCVFAVLGPDSI